MLLDLEEDSSDGSDIEENAKQGQHIVENIVVKGHVSQVNIRNFEKWPGNISGIVILSGKIIVADSGNTNLKLFDTNGKYLSSVDSMHLVKGIAKFDNNSFVSCRKATEIRLWTLRSSDIKCNDRTFNVDHICAGICSNGTYLSVLIQKAITVLDSQGRQVSKIVVEEAFGKKLTFGFDIHMDNITNIIFTLCVSKFPVNRGVLCVSLSGELLWFSPLPGNPWGTTEIHGVLCVTDINKLCLHLMSKDGKYKGKLLDKNDFRHLPGYICYDDSQRKLYFSILNSEKTLFCVVILNSDKLCFVSLQTKLVNKR